MRARRGEKLSLAVRRAAKRIGSECARVRRGIKVSKGRGSFAYGVIARNRVERMR